MSVMVQHCLITRPRHGDDCFNGVNGVNKNTYQKYMQVNLLIKKQIFASFPMFIMCSHRWNLKYSSTVQSDLELASACQEVKEEGSKMPLDFKHIQHMYVYMYILCNDTAYPFFFSRPSYSKETLSNPC